MDVKTNKLAKDIIIHCRKKIQSKFPFFSIAIYFLEPEADEDIETIGTDGYCLYYNPKYIIKQYKEDKNLIYLGIVHILLHCLLRHFSKKKSTYYELYDVSVDLTVYLMLYELQFITIKARKHVLKSLPELKDIFENNKRKGSVSIYNQAIIDDKLAKALLDNAHVFRLDNHIYWTKAKKNKDKSNKTMGSLLKSWDGIFLEVGAELRNGLMHGHGTGNFAQLFLAEDSNESQVSYEEFIRRFSTFEEVFKIDPESFDLMWYTTGLEMYDDMPIIEYNEIKEDYVINEFVLAIDTSGSCNGEIMESFLSQTIKIFQDMELGNRRIKAKIIQCDYEIVDEVDVSFTDDIEDYTNRFKTYGYGGTDFIPVFNRIKELQDNGEFTNLKGLIYLSDGYGDFPGEKPSYETVFVLPPDDWGSPNIPDWVETIELR